MRQLYQSNSEVDHRRAREVLANQADYLLRIAVAYLRNPFLKLTEAERASLPQKPGPVGIGSLVAARDAATRSAAARYVVFSMPKSGSSFLASALQQAPSGPATDVANQFWRRR